MNSDDAREAVAPHALMEQLQNLGETMPEALREHFMAAGEAVVPELIALVETALEAEADDESWSPVHAAELLGALGDERAVPVLLRCLQVCDNLEFLYQRAVRALIVLGPAAIDACLDAYSATSDGEMRDRLVDVLSQSPTPDERIYEALLDTLERSPELGAMFLSDYGDPRALPALSKAFDALPVKDDNSLLSNHVFVELRAAIEKLGGQLTQAQVAKAERADALRRRFAARFDRAISRVIKQQGQPPVPAPSSGDGAPARKTRKIGRNERCWCGSGKKYKKCHLDLDR